MTVLTVNTLVLGFLGGILGGVVGILVGVGLLYVFRDRIINQLMGGMLP